MDGRTRRCLVRLQRLCAARECCVAQVRRKALSSLDGDAEAAGEVVDALVSEGYVDDARYAGAFVREKSRLRGWGPVKIRFHLLRMGISEACVADALPQAESEGDEVSALLLRLVLARRKALGDDPQCRQKLVRFLLSKGHSYDCAVRVVAQALGEAGD